MGIKPLLILCVCVCVPYLIMKVKKVTKAMNSCHSSCLIFLVLQLNVVQLDKYKTTRRSRIQSLSLSLPLWVSYWVSLSMCACVCVVFSPFLFLSHPHPLLLFFFLSHCSWLPLFPTLSLSSPAIGPSSPAFASSSPLQCFPTVKEDSRFPKKVGSFASLVSVIWIFQVDGENMVTRSYASKASRIVENATDRYDIQNFNYGPVIVTRENYRKH